MIDFKIRKGPSSDLFIAPGEVNPRLIIENGCWYLTEDTAELFIGVLSEENKLTLKRINETGVLDRPTQAPDPDEPSRSIIDAFVNEETGMLHIVYNDDTEDVFGPVVGKDGVDGLNGKDGKDGEVVAIKIGDNVFEHVNGIIELPETDLGEYAKKDDIPEAPTKVSDLENDAGYITVADIPETDLSNYYTKVETGNLITEAVENITHPDTDLSGYATEEYVDNAIANIEIPSSPEINLDNYFNKTETISEITSALTIKANDVPFTTAKFINNPTGNFAVGDNINGLTIAEILAKLLGLSDEKPGNTPDAPEVPDEFESLEDLVKYLTSNQVNMYSQDENGILTITPFADAVWTQKEAAAQMDGVSTIYQIKDDSGDIIEAGYQESTDYNEEAWLTIALPNVIKNVEVKMFNPGVSDWEKMNWNVVKAAEQNIEGYTIWTVPEEYEVQSGDTYRFVIIN